MRNWIPERLELKSLSLNHSWKQAFRPRYLNPEHWTLLLQKTLDYADGLRSYILSGELEQEKEKITCRSWLMLFGIHLFPNWSLSFEDKKNILLLVACDSTEGTSLLGECSICSGNKHLMTFGVGAFGFLNRST